MYKILLSGPILFCFGDDLKDPFHSGFWQALEGRFQFFKGIIPEQKIFNRDPFLPAANETAAGQGVLRPAAIVESDHHPQLGTVIL